ncbi:MAG TPA: hypothetical protein VEL31_09995, partial [Ktedonobacteraceae bacterium]|nr:hypothetical protein [Ktedonobacteraceae bacterium]
YSSPMSQIVEIVSEPSATKNLGESSDTQALHAHFCPNFQPIYQRERSRVFSTWDMPNEMT